MYLVIDTISFALNSIFKIDNLSLEVNKGEMLGIIGPNGSGKTTLLRLIAGIINPHNGRILLNGKDIRKMGKMALAHIRAYVPEIIDIPFDYTVYEMVSLGRHPYTGMFSKLDQKDKTALSRAFKVTDINALKHRQFFTLSMGEKQRVMLAMAIAQEPKFLLLDEPISHLDIGHQLAFMRTLQQLNNNGITTIAAMHELSIAMAFFDRLCLMNNGRILITSSPDSRELLNNIKTVFGVNDERFIKYRAT